MAAISKQKHLLAELLDDTKSTQLDLSTVQADILLATDDLNRVLKGLEVAQDNLLVTRKQQEIVNDDLQRTKNEQISLEQTVARLNTEENRLLQVISDKEAELYHLEQRTVEATTAFDIAKTDREESLRQLDAKLLVVTTGIDQKLADEQLTRKSLAEWQTKLESQDQNLRIREMKVSEGETKIVRNSALLDL